MNIEINLTKMQTSTNDRGNCIACGDKLHKIDGKNHYECKKCSIDMEEINGLIQISMIKNSFKTGVKNKRKIYI